MGCRPGSQTIDGIASAQMIVTTATGPRKVRRATSGDELPAFISMNG